MAYAFQAEGLVKRFRKTTAWPGSTWPPAGYGPWGARAERRGQDDGDPHPGHAAAPGRRPRRGGRAGRRPARAPGAPADRPHRAVRLGRRGPHRRGEPHPHRGAARPARRRGEGPGRRAAGPVRADRGSRAASLHLLRWHAPPPRPGREPGRQPEGHLPRRADDRSGPGQARGRVAHDPPANRRRRHGAAHHPVPEGGRCPRRRDRGHPPRHGHRARHSGRAQGDRGRADHRRPPQGHRPTRRRRRVRRCRPPAGGGRDRDGRAGAAAAKPRRGVLHPHRTTHPRARPAGTRSEREGSMTDTITVGRRTAPAAALPKRPWALARHSLVLAKRSLRKTSRNPGVLSDALLLPVVFLVLFVYLFGGAVAGSTRGYLQYIFPGILVMSTILAGMLATGVNLNLDIKKGVFDRLRSLPIGRSAPLIGSVLGDMIRYIVALAVVFAVGYLLGFRIHTDPLAALAAGALAIAFSFSLSWVNVLVGVLIRETVIVQSVAFLGIFPLAFGTSMVAPTKTLPGWLQAWVNVNPVTHAVEATRGLLLGGPVAGPATKALLWSAAIFAVFAPLAVRVYRRRA